VSFWPEWVAPRLFVSQCPHALLTLSWHLLECSDDLPDIGPINKARPPACRSIPVHDAWKATSVQSFIKHGDVQRCLTQDLLGDHYTLDLVGALVDLGDLGIAHEALYREIGRVPVAPEQLNCVSRDRHRCI
jgi:hypothetical protein